MFVCLFVVIMHYILTLLTRESVKHTFIKVCNNKIEQGENNVLLYVCVCSYLGGEKSFITFTVNSQCQTCLEGIMVVNCPRRVLAHPQEAL